MENTKAIKLIDKILKNLDKKGVNTDTLIDDIKELRTYALEAQVPLVVKVLRYTYEHIEKHGAFLVSIPEDEAIDEEAIVGETESASPIESLKYLIALMRNLKNKGNISDLQEYKTLLMAY